MTSKSSKSNNKKANKPFLLKAVGKDYIWGGNRLNTEFGKNISLEPLSETWECSVHPDGVSVVASGEFEGQPLDTVLKKHPEFLGTHSSRNGEMPILVKFIDAKKDLSVQVHPTDEYAEKHENGQLGKTEMWYVVSAAKDARIVYGFNRDMDKDTLRESLKSGKIEEYLSYVPAKKDDMFFIEAGTVHAIGAGTLVAEVQENSNLTYRLYDYNRVDKHGNKRELHIDKALDVVRLKSSADPRQPMRVLKYREGCATEILCRCKYFEVGRMLVNTEVLRKPIGFKSDALSFRVLMCIDGCGSLRYTDNKKSESIDFYKGDTVFVPASSVEIGIHGKAQFLDVRC